MVLNFTDLDINLQWKWFLRPRQRDAVTVDDYYAQFCDWKEEMIRASFPATEADYIEGFIDNLRWDIRWRSSKYVSSRIGLTIAFHNAKFEESMMQLEAYSHTHVVVNHTAESDPIAVEEVCVDDDGSVAHEKGSELSSCIHSNWRSETTDEHYSNEDFEVNELPDCVEMLDFNGIEINDSTNSELEYGLEEYKVSESEINSHSSFHSSHQKQVAPMDSGLNVMSIYCAHMATKWSHVLDSQPIQGNDMSVEVYYDHFFNWKRKLEEVNYIGSEESYIDDFLYGLEIKLGMRVWGYKWKPSTLYGAFRRAVIEQSMMQNDADKVLEEMPHPNEVDSRGAEDVSDEYVDVMLDASVHMDDTFWSDLPVESILQGEKSQVDVLEDPACKVFNELVKPNSTYLQLALEYHEPAVTENVEQTLSDRVGKPSVMTMECLKVARNLFDEMTNPSPIYRHSFPLFPIEVYEWLVDDSSNYKPDDDFELNKILTFMFDPGGSSFWHSVGCDSINSNSGQQGEKVDDVGSIHHLFDKRLRERFSAELNKVYGIQGLNAYNSILLLDGASIKFAFIPSTLVQQNWTYLCSSVWPVCLLVNGYKMIFRSGLSVICPIQNVMGNPRDVHHSQSLLPPDHYIGHYHIQSSNISYYFKELHLILSSNNSVWDPGQLEEYDILHNSVWDPGLRKASVYILEDKDAFQRMGKWTIRKDHIMELVTLSMFMFSMNWCQEVYVLQELRRSVMVQGLHISFEEFKDSKKANMEINRLDKRNVICAMLLNLDFYSTASCKDETNVVNLELELQKLSTVSWVVKNDLSFGGRHILRVFEVHDVVDEFTAYNIRSKLVWGHFSTGGVTWFIECSKDTLRTLHHYVLMKHGSLLKLETWRCPGVLKTISPQHFSAEPWKISCHMNNYPTIVVEVAVMSKIFRMGSRCLSFLHLEDKAVFEGKDMS